jgi:hypothetical protein
LVLETDLLQCYDRGGYVFVRDAKDAKFAKEMKETSGETQ